MCNTISKTPNKCTKNGIKHLLRDLARKQTKRNQHCNMIGAIPPGRWHQEHRRVWYWSSGSGKQADKNMIATGHECQGKMPWGSICRDLEQVIGMSPQGTRFLHKGVAKSIKLRWGVGRPKQSWPLVITSDNWLSAQTSWPRQAPDVHQLAKCLYQLGYLGVFQIDEP